MLNTVPVNVNYFSWFFNVNFARNRNSIIDLYEGIDEYNLYESWNYGNTRIGTLAIVGGKWTTYRIMARDLDSLNRARLPRGEAPSCTLRSARVFATICTM